MAGHLHDHRVDSALEHRRQQCLQVRRFRVVSELGTAAPLMRVPTVPITPTEWPAAIMWRLDHERGRRLPEVPVIPITVNERLGSR